MEFIRELEKEKLLQCCKKIKLLDRIEKLSKFITYGKSEEYHNNLILLLKSKNLKFILVDNVLVLSDEDNLLSIMNKKERECLRVVEDYKLKGWVKHGNFIMTYCGSSIAVQYNPFIGNFFDTEDNLTEDIIFDQLDNNIVNVGETITVTGKGFTNLEYISIVDDSNNILAQTNINVISDTEFQFIVPSTQSEESYLQYMYYKIIPEFITDDSNACINIMFN